MSPEMEARAAVVQEALSWLGTPYHHRAQVKGGGVDCGQLPLAVFEAVGLIPHVDPGDYPHDWHLHQDEERYLAIVERFCHRLQDGAKPHPADLALYRFGRCISHGGIVIAWPTILHSHIEAGEVVLDDTFANHGLAKRLVGCWRLRRWGGAP